LGFDPLAYEGRVHKPLGHTSNSQNPIIWYLFCSARRAIPIGEIFKILTLVCTFFFFGAPLAAYDLIETCKKFLDETANGVVHNPAEYIASKFPSDIHLIPAGIKNTFSGMEHRLEDIKTGTTNAITGTKDWIGDKSSKVYYSAVQHFYNTLAKFFGGLEYIWNGASYVFYSAMEGVLWLTEKGNLKILWIKGVTPGSKIEIFLDIFRGNFMRIIDCAHSRNVKAFV
jgi:hypothetical protein